MAHHVHRYPFQITICNIAIYGHLPYCSGDSAASMLASGSVASSSRAELGITLVYSPFARSAICGESLDLESEITALTRLFRSRIMRRDL